MKTSVKKFLELLKPDSPYFSENSTPAKDIQTPAKQLQIEITHNESSKHDNVTEFWFKPTLSIKLKKVLVKIENDEDIIEGNTLIEYDKNKWYLLAGYEDVRTGDKWIFTFVYSLADQNKTSTLKINYTV